MSRIAAFAIAAVLVVLVLIDHVTRVELTDEAEDEMAPMDATDSAGDGAVDWGEFFMTGLAPVGHGVLGPSTHTFIPKRTAHPHWSPAP
jgi:hypothetical protein